MKNFKSFYLAKSLLMMAMLSSTYIQAQSNYEADMNKQPYHKVGEKKIALRSSTSTNTTFKVSASTIKILVLGACTVVLMFLVFSHEFNKQSIKKACSLIYKYFKNEKIKPSPQDEEIDVTTSMIVWEILNIVGLYIFLPLAFLGFSKLVLWMYLPEKNTNNRYTSREE